MGRSAVVWQRTVVATTFALQSVITARWASHRQTNFLPVLSFRDAEEERKETRKKKGQSTHFAQMSPKNVMLNGLIESLHMHAQYDVMHDFYYAIIASTVYSVHRSEIQQSFNNRR